MRMLRSQNADMMASTLMDQCRQIMNDGPPARDKVLDIIEALSFAAGIMVAGTDGDKLALEALTGILSVAFAFCHKDGRDLVVAAIENALPACRQMAEAINDDVESKL